MARPNCILLVMQSDLHDSASNSKIKLLLLASIFSNERVLHLTLTFMITDILPVNFFIESKITACTFDMHASEAPYYIYRSNQSNGSINVFTLSIGWTLIHPESRRDAALDNWLLVVVFNTCFSRYSLTAYAISLCIFLICTKAKIRNISDDILRKLINFCTIVTHSTECKYNMGLLAMWNSYARDLLS